MRVIAGFRHACLNITRKRGYPQQLHDERAEHLAAVQYAAIDTLLRQDDSLDGSDRDKAGDSPEAVAAALSRLDDLC